MLKMGFAEDVETILADTPDDKQVALFSATMPAAIRRMSKQYLHDPEEITVKTKTHDVGDHHAALPRRLVPAEDRRPHAHPRGRELRGHDRLRPHEERHRGARREAPRARLLGRRDQRRHRPGAARAHGQPAEVGQARHPGGHGCRGARPRRRAHQPRGELRHPHRHRVVRAPHRPHRPRRPHAATRSASSRPASADSLARIEKATRQPLIADAAAERRRRQRHAPRPLRRPHHRGARPGRAHRRLPRHHRALRAQPRRARGRRRGRPRGRRAGRVAAAARARARAPRRAERERFDRDDRDRGGRGDRGDGRGAERARGERPERRPRPGAKPMATYRIAVGRAAQGRAAPDRRRPRERGRPQPRRLRRDPDPARLLARRAARRPARRHARPARAAPASPAG